MKFGYLIEPPFNFVNPNGYVTGCDVELARYILSQLDADEFEPIETEFSELLPGVGDGRWRMTTGLFATAERQKAARFSQPIWALADGLLVRAGNPKQLTGYGSIAANSDAKMAVIQDQFQHRTAVEYGVPKDRIEIFETYTQAAIAVRDGRVDAYASVGRAHSGFMEQHPEWNIELISVPSVESPPAFGSFAFALNDVVLVQEVDAILTQFLGSQAHRKLVSRFGFTDSDVDLVAKAKTQKI